MTRIVRVLALVLAALLLPTAANAAPPAWPDLNPSADAKVRETAVSIPAGDHDVPAILTLPKAGGAAQSYSAVLMLHGFASQKDEVGDMYAREARALAARGVASLRIVFAGTGDSAQPYTSNTFTGMVKDALTAYDWLVANPRTHDDQVAVLGFSMGSKVGLEVLAQRPGAAAFGSWSGALQDGMPEGYGQYYDQARADGSVVLDLGFTVVELSLAWFDTMAASTPLTDALGYDGPVLAVAGSADTTVAPDVSRTFLGLLDSGDETLVIVPDADHIYHVLTTDQSDAELVVTATADWFASRLAPRG